jgi:L-2,4-diaminobutyrate decarboxylase
MSFTDDARITIQALHDYEQESMAQEVPVIHQRPMAELVAELGLAAWVRDGGLHGEKLGQFLDSYLSVATRLHHPGYLAHQVAIPHYAGALGSLIDGFTNNAMAIYEMGPAAASIEYFVINWLLQKVGWRPAPLPGHDPGAGLFGGGVLTHGGSLANLTALTAARNRLAPQVWQDGNPDDLAVLAPRGAHYSIARAAGILGIGSKALYELEVDGQGKVIPERMAAACQRMQDDGKRAVAVVANACSTAVGIYDPLDEMGDFCREHGLWFHIDGAHGASALVSRKHRQLLRGVEKADSLVWDAHKMMRTPTVCAAVLVRDHRTLDAAFEQEASYLFHDKEQPGFDFIQRTVECTKAGLGLRLFLTLAALGEKGMEAYIDHQFAVTLQAYEYLQTQPDIDCPVKPQANILCFRLHGDDALQIHLRDQLIAAGHFYLSTTSFGGKRYLRAVFMNPQTGLEHVKQLVAEIRCLAAA